MRARTVLQGTFCRGNVFEELSVLAYYPETIVHHFKPMYMKVTDAITNSIKWRFEQPEFKVFGQVEKLLLKSIRKNSVVNEIETLQAKFGGDYAPNSLMAELGILTTISGESQPIILGAIVNDIQSLSMKNLL